MECPTRSNPSASEVALETAFPLKLHSILNESEKQGFDDVISWQGTNAFMVHKPKKFEESIMKEYFNQTLYKSFQKQLELHGFKRLAVGEKFGGSYTHNLLIRGQSNMCRFMVKTETMKKSRLLRRRSAPIIRRRAIPNDSSSPTSPSPPHQQQRRSYHGRSLSSDFSPHLMRSAMTRAPRRNTTGTGRRRPSSSILPGSLVPNFTSSIELPVEEDMEPLPHDHDEDDKFPEIIECEHGRTTKKHRRNSSWSSPVINSGAADSASAMEWLSSPSGVLKPLSPQNLDPPLVEENEEDMFQKIVDVGDCDDVDTHSIHSFSSLPMDRVLTMTCSIPRPSDEVLGVTEVSTVSSSDNHHDDSSEGTLPQTEDENSPLRVLDASLEVLKKARGDVSTP